MPPSASKDVGTLTITARRPTLPMRRVGPRVTIDGLDRGELPWGEAVTFELAVGEHDVVVDRDGIAPTDTCCWVDDKGVRLEFVTPMAWYRSPRIRYLD